MNPEQRSATAADFADATGGLGESTRPAFQQPSGQEHGGQAHTPPEQHPQDQPAQGQSSQPQDFQVSPHAGTQAHSAQAHQGQPAYPGQSYAAQPYAPQAQTHYSQGYGPQSNPQQYGAQGHQHQPPHGYTSTSRQQPVHHDPAPAPRGSGARLAAKITPSGWLLRGLVLVGVSVLSGVVWLLVKPHDPSEDPAPPHRPVPQGKFQFQPELREEGFRGCGKVSTEQIKEYFQQHQCEHLTRALYSTTLPDGQRVLTSVVTIRMPDPQSAAQLNALVTKDGTGNVVDLVSAGRDLPDEYPKLSQDVGYYSEQQDRLVVVGESGYFDKSASYEDGRLVEVTRDALRLGWPQDSG